MSGTGSRIALVDLAAYDIETLKRFATKTTFMVRGTQCIISLQFTHCPWIRPWRSMSDLFTTKQRDFNSYVTLSIELSGGVTFKQTFRG